MDVLPRCCYLDFFEIHSCVHQICDLGACAIVADRPLLPGDEAKHQERSCWFRTWGVRGTSNYMAPEVFSSAAENQQYDPFQVTYCIETKPKKNHTGRHLVPWSTSVHDA